LTTVKKKRPGWILLVLDFGAALPAPEAPALDFSRFFTKKCEKPHKFGCKTIIYGTWHTVSLAFSRKNEGNPGWDEPFALLAALWPMIPLVCWLEII